MGDSFTFRREDHTDWFVHCTPTGVDLFYYDFRSGVNFIFPELNWEEWGILVSKWKEVDEKHPLMIRKTQDAEIRLENWYGRLEFDFADRRIGCSIEYILGLPSVLEEIVKWVESQGKASVSDHPPGLVWLDYRVREDKKLYEKYGKPLEGEHKGKFVAIGPTGEYILGQNHLEVFEKALAQFGRGNFAFKRLGHKATMKWRKS